ncbi:SGNH/GDSL hydrolase family protein [Catenulispora subtropica]|uniref:SGNH/GDSL hydrolase family protein n=1 Tax=Catenulispora subtropica TaxID=450798 RepID=A0ABP5C2Q5_9ACTN
MDFTTLSARQGKLMVSVGDSFTEGMCDDTLPDGTFRGWADRVAERLAQDDPQLRYANLAVRGKLIGQIERDQVPLAASMDADVITLAGGLNDVLRPRCDIELVEAKLRSCLEQLATEKATVVMFLPTDPRRRMRGSQRLMPNTHRLMKLVEGFAETHGVVVVDLFSARVFDDPRLWAEDRLHLSPEGHRRVAEAVLQALGAEEGFDWRAGLPPARPAPWFRARRQDLRWIRIYLLPWIGRRLTGKSSGDGRPAKRPEPTLVADATSNPAADATS